MERRFGRRPLLSLGALTAAGLGVKACTPSWMRPFSEDEDALIARQVVEAMSVQIQETELKGSGLVEVQNTSKFIRDLRVSLQRVIDHPENYGDVVIITCFSAIEADSAGIIELLNQADLALNPFGHGVTVYSNDIRYDEQRQRFGVAEESHDGRQDEGLSFVSTAGNGDSLTAEVRRACVAVSPKWLRFIREDLCGRLGRDHMKLFYIEGEGLWMGGLNLDDENLEERADLMLKMRPGYKLYEMIRDGQISLEKPWPPGIMELNDTDWIYRDGFESGDSIIFEHFCKFAQRANSRILVTSVYPLSDRVLDILIAASNRGIEVELIVSRDDDQIYQQGVFAPLYKRMVRKLNQADHQIKLRHSASLLHAKLFVVDGVAFIGSHNMQEMGVWAGTGELEFVTIDPDIVEALVAEFRQLATAADQTNPTRLN